MSVQKKKMYDVEFKIASAKLAKDSSQSVAQTARDLGLNENTLHGWIKKYIGLSETAGAVPVAKEIPLYEELKHDVVNQFDTDQLSDFFKFQIG